MRPSWYPVREVICLVTGDWCEAQCQKAEQAMAKAIIGEIERVGIAPRSWEIGPRADAWQKLKREAPGED